MPDCRAARIAGRSCRFAGRRRAPEGKQLPDPQLGLAVALAAAHLALGSKTDNAGVATEAKAADPRAGVAIAQASSAKEGDTAKAELGYISPQHPRRRTRATPAPSAQQHMRAAIELPLASASPKAHRPPLPPSAAVAAPVALRTGDTAASTGEGEGRANDDTAFADKTAAAPRAASNGEAAKPVAQAFTLPGAETSADVRPLSSSARPIASDQFANVERVVDQIMAARQADLSKPAAIAVAHREFGQLTVTFDRTADGMNVEVAAQDGETQRALAAAMANERPVARHTTALRLPPTRRTPTPRQVAARLSKPGTVRAMRIPMIVTRFRSSRSSGRVRLTISTPCRTVVFDDALYA